MENSKLIVKAIVDEYVGSYGLNLIPDFQVSNRLDNTFHCSSNKVSTVCSPLLPFRRLARRWVLELYL